MLFPELEEEAERATTVKRSQPILVILGNPPYNRFAGVAEDEEADLIEAYKNGLYEKWGIRKQLLDDLYIRFFRLAERRISEIGGRGIVCYIYQLLVAGRPLPSRHAGAAGRGLRRCPGSTTATGTSSRPASERPTASPDESMFTTDEHSVGIQIGTAIATLVKRGSSGAKKVEARRRQAQILYRNLWGTGNEKRAMLTRSLACPASESDDYATFSARAAMRWVFANGTSGQSEASGSWPKLADLFPVHYSGLNENRCNAFIAIDRDEIERRMVAYFDGSLSLAELAERVPRRLAEPLDMIRLR